MSLIIRRIATVSATAALLLGAPIAAHAAPGPEIVQDPLLSTFGIVAPFAMPAPVVVSVKVPATLPVHTPERASFISLPATKPLGDLQPQQVVEKLEEVREGHDGFYIAVDSFKPLPEPEVPSVAGATARATIVQAALSEAGTPYVWGGNTTEGWDCSGFVKWAYKQAGINTARTTSTILASGQFERTETPRPGDLVFQRAGKHVGIYLGDGKMIGAQTPETGTKVVPVTLSPMHGYYTLKD